MAHTYVAYSVFKGLFPGKKSKYLKNFVRGPGCPLNASFGRDMHFEKERIDLKGSRWTKQYKGKYKFGRLSSVNEKEMIFILADQYKKGTCCKIISAFNSQTPMPHFVFMCLT